MAGGSFDIIGNSLANFEFAKRNSQASLLDFLLENTRKNACKIVGVMISFLKAYFYILKI